MLQALELAGFKSFADRTRLEFPRGITVVVGPNGSGKSNVVDAFKWVMGAQGVKALRGKERSDVIFSGSGARRPAGAAEVTLSFDNSTGLFDAHPEQDGENATGAATTVEIGRRLYRSGESEYLINRQPRRLRDVRDALAGAGLGAGAYSIIEQGKVDALLRASPQERRLLFEEAAGIARFKMKREEAARRLERVQQNLLRLTDTVEELRTQLVRVRSQAGRAKKYQDVRTRLKDLQTRVSVADWRRLTILLTKLTDQLADQRAELTGLNGELAENQADLHQAEQSAEQLQVELGELADAEANVREQSAQCETRRQSQAARIDEIRAETDRLAHQLLIMTSRAGDSQQLVEQTEAEHKQAVERHAELQALVDAEEAELAEAQRQFSAAREAVQEKERQLDELGRKKASQLNAAELCAVRLAAIADDDARRATELAKARQRRDRLGEEHAAAAAELAAASAAAERAAVELAERQQQLQSARVEFSKAQKQHVDLQGRLSGARERTAVLEELQRRLEGLTAGAKEALRRAREDPAGPYGAIRGVVADLLHVDADSAAMIETALGDAANFLAVVDAPAIEAELLDEANSLPGRVTLLRLDVPAPARAVDRLDLTGEPGVIGRADGFVETAPDLTALVHRLLSRYWLVDGLATALRLAAGPGRGLNFVTVACEIVTADGAVTVGPPTSSTGILTRRSELRALNEQVTQMENDGRSLAARCERLEAAIPSAETAAQELATRHAALCEQAGDARSQHAALTDRLQQVDEQIAQLAGDAEAAAADAVQLESQEQAARRDCRRYEELADRLQTEVERETAALAAETDRVELLRQATTEKRVALAGCEQRRNGLCRQIEQLQRDHEERDRALAEMRNQAREAVAARAALEASNQQLLLSVDQLAERRRTIAAQSEALQARQVDVRRQRVAAAERADEIRRAVAARQRTLQQIELQVQQLDNQREAISARMAADYQIDLAELAEATDDSATDDSAGDGAAADDALAGDERAEIRAAIDAEIRELHESLASAGPVNLEAVEELDQLEVRYRDLAAQHDDLQTARQRLEQIVGRMNTESRELFAQTMEEVRGHFRELFSKLFGGGEAEILVEQDEGGDLLECGVEIVACPPGKQPRSISLLSGGERTLTCVALLLAMFKSRPSPVCILDEVDAALDEANIDRFVQVLREFMGATQFIVITHSKRTMSAGDTLYGVTMQDSGVSKRVSVRFEDVTTDGRIKPAALARAA